MIHISIPTTQTLVEMDGSRTYDAFDIYINGAYHASIRYSHLLKLHEKLRNHFGPKLKTSDFPSKKLFRTLDQKALDERRLALARYFQTMVQLQSIAQHFITENAFLNFQIESFRPSSSNVSVDIFMADGTKETVRCNVEHPTEIILKRFADIIGLSIENIGSFGLFVAKRRYASDDGHFMSSLGSVKYPDTLSVRLLRNFESPYLSIHMLNQKSAATGVFYFIIIRKLIWDPKVEEELMDDPGAVLLLYKQAASDLYNGHFVPRQTEIKNRLLALEEQGNCTQFLRLCHLEPNYSYEVLEPCSSNYPRPGTECNLKIGRRRILLEFKGEGAKDGISSAEFRATRIRVWRISEQDNSGFTFLFEYLISKGVFHWITLYTNQAILLSLLLQSIGFEILKEHRSLMTTFGSVDYDYPTKDVFKIYSSQEEDSMGSPVISRAVQYSTPMENEVQRISVQPKEVERTKIIENHDDSLTNGRSDNGSIHSNHHSNSITDIKHSGSIASDLDESVLDAFTTISKTLLFKSEGFEITDDDL
ncbi:PX domain containing protein [Brugia malayi]|uniref:PX domain containing protein n=1 Tax=Brugia malayi TaxID=6279 RepID=A0A4E9FSD1_BRUMA|nr:PX domain containing protein [Brugia malayi]VIP00136.1 PX domain containing protein [Brugia malayi]